MFISLLSSPCSSSSLFLPSQISLRKKNVEHVFLDSHKFISQLAYAIIKRVQAVDTQACAEMYTSFSDSLKLNSKKQHLPNGGPEN